MLHFSVVLVLYIFCIGYTWYNECDNAYGQNWFFNTYMSYRCVNKISDSYYYVTDNRLHSGNNPVRYRWVWLKMIFHVFIIMIITIHWATILITIYSFAYVCINYNQYYPWLSNVVTQKIGSFNSNIFRFHRLFIEYYVY